MPKRSDRTTRQKGGQDLPQERFEHSGDQSLFAWRVVRCSADTGFCRCDRFRSVPSPNPGQSSGLQPLPEHRQNALNWGRRLIFIYALYIRMVSGAVQAGKEYEIMHSGPETKHMAWNLRVSSAGTSIRADSCTNTEFSKDVFHQTPFC